MKTLLIAAVALTLCGCAVLKDRVIVGTSTVLGFEVAQNPATEMYQARLGYGRMEMAIVPTNNVEVLTEMRFNNVFGSGGVYQRMAVGGIAVRQSMFMFARDSSGALTPQAAEVITRAMPAFLSPAPTNSTPKAP
jgi:hypothetical protein